MTHPRWPLLGALVVALQGCAISTPLQRPPLEGGPVTVVITAGRLHADQRAEFDRQTALVLRTLPAQPGLLAYTARRELLGNQVWTMTVWQDPAALARFLAAPAHREALARGMPALQDMVSVRRQMPRTQVPTDWAGALAVLRESPQRPYWE